MKQRDYSTGISNCRYAVHNGPFVGELKRLPGAVKLTRRPSSDSRTFVVREGGRAYSYTAAAKEKERRYALEIVSLTKAFLTEVLGFTENEDGSLTEGIRPDVHISLFYETDNGSRPVRYQLYDCAVETPSFDAATMSESLSADTRKLEFTANPDPYNEGAYGRQIARADNAETFDTWFGEDIQI